MQMRYFRCPVCHIQMMAPKRKNAKKSFYKGKAHRKDMWCAICKEDRSFIQAEAFFVRAR